MEEQNSSTLQKESAEEIRTPLTIVLPNYTELDRRLFFRSLLNVLASVSSYSESKEMVGGDSMYMSFELLKALDVND